MRAGATKFFDGVEEFDVTQLNARVYREENRTYRWMLLATLAFLIVIGAGSAIAFTGPTPLRPHNTQGNLPLIAAFYLIVVLMSGLLAYGSFWMYRPGASAVAVDSEGFTLKFSGGRDAMVRWSAPGVSVRISAFGPAGYVEPSRGFTQAAIQGLRYPHFELTEPALVAILASAKAHRLTITELMVPLSSDRVWGRIWIQNSKRQ